MRVPVKHALVGLFYLLVVGTLFAFQVGLSRSDIDTTPPAVRPADWAQRVEAEGVPNLHRVSDALYRGGQPNAEGFLALEKLGVRTVINLRTFHSDREKLEGTDLAYEHVRTLPTGADEEDVAAFLRIVTDPARTPAFVHCQRGADRTGMMCAAYRIVVQGWAKDEAIREMTRGGFEFHTGFDQLLGYVRKMDVSDLKRRAGLDGHSGASAK